MATHGERRALPGQPYLRVRLGVRLRVGATDVEATVRAMTPQGLLLHVLADAAAGLAVGQAVSLSVAAPDGAGAVVLQGTVARRDEATDLRGRDAAALVVMIGTAPTYAHLFTQVRERRRLQVLAVGFADDALGWRGAVDPAASVAAVRPDDLERTLAEQEVAVLVVGPALPAADACALLTRVADSLPNLDTVTAVFTAAADLSPFQDLVSCDRLFFLARQPTADAEVAAIAGAALRRYREKERRSEEPAGVAAVGEERWQQILACANDIALQADLGAAGVRMERAIEELLRPLRAYCLIYDEAAEILFARESPTDEPRRDSAAVGLCSYVARTGQALEVARVGEDPRYDREVDDPRGRGDERLVAIPVRAPTGEVVAVFVVISAAGAAPLAPPDRATLELLAERCGVVLGQSLAVQAIKTSAQRAASRGPQRDIFRAEALERHAEGRGGRGHVLELSPRWIRVGFVALALVVVAGLASAAVARVGEYAEGPAVVRAVGRTGLTAFAPGSVVQVCVQPGQRVATGDVLLKFYDAQEHAEHARAQREFDLQLVHRLRDPADPAPRQALLALHSQRKLAGDRLAERTVRAPHDGFATDVRVRVGQHVAAGDLLMTIAGREANYVIVGLLPGQHRPQLRSGLPLRLELTGFERSFHTLTVASVGDEVIGPQEAKRYLGQEKADALAATGPVVLIEAPLVGGRFRAGAKTYDLHDGMVGTARVRVRSTPLLVALIPGLQRLWESADAR
jgi:membrane fusion protein (multidrug efflux system)